MSKRRRKTQTEPTSSGSDTVTLSVRLTEPQRKLLEQAASLRGWNPTNLLRVAALERSAAIVNTSTLTSTDFRGMARQIAEQMFGRRTARGFGDDGEIIDLDAVADVRDLGPWDQELRPVEVSPWRLSDEFLVRLREAAKRGAGEFMNLIVQSADELTARNQKNLPDPIDPTTLE